MSRNSRFPEGFEPTATHVVLRNSSLVAGYESTTPMAPQTNPRIGSWLKGAVLIAIVVALVAAALFYRGIYAYAGSVLAVSH